MEWLVRTLICLTLVLGESVLYALLGVENFTLQLGLAATIVLGLSRNFSASAFVLVMILWPMEWVVRGEPGHYVFGAVTVFFFLRLFSGRIKSTKAQLFFVAFFAGILHSSLMMLTIFLLNPDSMSLSAIFSNMAWAAFLLSFGTILVSSVFQFFSSFHTERRENALEKL